MVNTISKEALKSALIDLAQSEREFFLTLVSDALQQPGTSNPDSATLNAADNQVVVNLKKRRKPLPERVVPAYRLKQADWSTFKASKTALESLQDLFADSAPAEEIIATLTK